VWFRLNGWSPEAARMVTAVRVAAGGRDLYEALADSGRVATQGVYFETASDQLRPESTPTLKAIAAMLAAHPALRLTIEGHTDAAGDARVNQALSERRAAAVRAALVGQFGADAGRLAAVGRGASRPAAPNATAEGRQMNRRVELVRQ
jgi:outer membrane protein OmpA-like peptidoglycan-associated protein